MNKCPKCGAVLNTLSRICEACGSEIRAEASPVSASADVSPAPLGAAQLCKEIQDDLALLATRPPASRLAAFLTGLITLPTLGLGYLAVRGAHVFGQVGKSAERARLSLEQNVRMAQNSFKADNDVRALASKAKDELTEYHRCQHASRLTFMAGIMTSLILVLAASGGWLLYQKYLVEKARQSVMAAQLAADANQAALKLQQEKDQQQQHEEAVAAAQEVHKKAVELADRLGANTGYKAAILVENRAGNDLSDKIPVLEDKLNSRLAGKGFSVLSQATVDRAESALTNTGAHPETVNLVGHQFGTLAQSIGADFIIYVSISSFDNEKKSFVGYGVATDNYTYTLRGAYRLIEAGETSAIAGTTFVANKTIRQSGDLQTDSTGVINDLLDDAASQVADAILKSKPTPANGSNAH